MFYNLKYFIKLDCSTKIIIYNALVFVKRTVYNLLLEEV